MKSANFHIITIIITLSLIVLAVPTIVSAHTLAFSCADVTEIPKSECEALVALYNSTGGANWIIKDNWLVTTTPGDWYGVTVSGGHVSYIDPIFNNLTGSIPPELGNLPALWGLELGGNQLTGSIPPELGNLTNLASLYLNNNQLTGSIPPELGNLPGLVWLTLYSNQLTGSIPPQLGNLTALWHLDLSSNELTGSIPSELGNLTNLASLYLNNNQLTGSVPPELGNLPALWGLELGGNQLTGSIPPQLGNLTALQWLYLQNNPLTGSIPLSFVNLSNLVFFIFSDTDLCEPTAPEYLAWKTTVLGYEGTGVTCEIEYKGYSIFLPSMQK
jgi:Leucine-rich repeat (LRR) protein